MRMMMMMMIFMILITVRGAITYALIRVRRSDHSHSASQGGAVFIGDAGSSGIFSSCSFTSNGAVSATALCMSDGARAIRI